MGIIDGAGGVVAKSDEIVIKQKEGEVEINPGMSFDIDANDFYGFVFRYFWWLVVGVIMFGSLVAGTLVVVYETGLKKRGKVK